CGARRRGAWHIGGERRGYRAGDAREALDESERLRPDHLPGTEPQPARAIEGIPEIARVRLKRAGEVEWPRHRVTLAQEIDQDLLGRKPLDVQVAELHAHAAVERRGQVGADRAARERRRGRAALQ